MYELSGHKGSTVSAQTLHNPSRDRRLAVLMGQAKEVTTTALNKNKYEALTSVIFGYTRITGSSTWRWRIASFLAPHPPLRFPEASKRCQPLFVISHIHHHGPSPLIGPFYPLGDHTSNRPATGVKVEVRDGVSIRPGTQLPSILHPSQVDAHPKTL